MDFSVFNGEKVIKQREFLLKLGSTGKRRELTIPGVNHMGVVVLESHLDRLGARLQRRCTLRIRHRLLFGLWSNVARHEMNNFGTSGKALRAILLLLLPLIPLLPPDGLIVIKLFQFSLDLVGLVDGE